MDIKTFQFLRWSRKTAEEHLSKRFVIPNLHEGKKYYITRSDCQKYNKVKLDVRRLSRAFMTSQTTLQVPCCSL